MATIDLSARPSDRESGQILILTAVTMIVLLGIAALTLDASFMYDKRNQLHAAADAAAKSAAIEIARQGTGVAIGSLRNFADQQVNAHGFTPVRLGGTTIVDVNHGPASGPFAGNAGFVEVIVSQPTGTFFARILGTNSMTPTARAVAGSSNPQNCMIVKEDLTFGNSAIHSNGCGVAVGGDIDPTKPGSTIDGTPLPSVGVHGDCVGVSCDQMGVLTLGAPVPTDPLAGLPLPTNPGGCVAGTAATLTPGCYTSIAGSVTTLTAGIYYVTGRVDVDNLSGTNVMIYLSGSGQLGAASPGNNKIITLTAPTSGTYKGIAIFQDPANASDIDIKNSFTFTVTGALYFPGADINFKNNLTITNTSCTLFIGKSLNFDNGTGTFTNSGCATTFGGAVFLGVSIAQ